MSSRSVTTMFAAACVAAASAAHALPLTGRPSGDANLALLGLADDNRSLVRSHWDFPAEVGAVWHF